MNLITRHRLLTQPLVKTQQRNFYGLLYRIFVKRDESLVKDINVPSGMEVDRSQPKSTNEARDKYVADKLRDMMYNMKETQTPKGVWFSTFVMSAPLLMATGYLGVLSPIASNAALVDPNQFAYIARTCLRLLSLNISFIGGIHYGLGSATYDTARTDEERRAVNIQLLYSFVPASMAFGTTSFLLFSSPLTMPTVVYAFTGLMITQLVTLKFDYHCVSKEMAPLWFKKYRGNLFAIYMVLTSALFFIFYSNIDQI